MSFIVVSFSERSVSDEQARAKQDAAWAQMSVRRAKLDKMTPEEKDREWKLMVEERRKKRSLLIQGKEEKNI